MPSACFNQGDEMAVQGIWSGTISFSLVAIPVQLVRAVAPGRVSFRLLHSKDYSPLARRMFCPEQETMVPPDEIIRGYEIAPDRQGGARKVRAGRARVSRGGQEHGGGAGPNHPPLQPGNTP